MADQPNIPSEPQQPELPLAKNQIPVNIEDEMRRSYLDYAMSVIIGRALPDARDGMKPVQRRILYGMYEAGLRANRPYRKCAKIVGEVMGNYHPHGDVPIYDSLVRMAQDFSMRYPLVDGQGNFGSVDGDPPAAMRYTEARLASVAERLLDDIERDTVDFRPNYDESTEEPEYLPTRVPNLLVNGAEGIAVGMATKIPPHNLGEIINATIHLIEHPNAALEKLVEMVPGPDFPTGGFLYGKSGILEAYRTGRGSFILRARAAIERMGKDREMIVVTEIPYQVNKAKLIERAAELVQEKKIEGISDIRDESDRDGMRIVFELKRGEQAEVILNNLYKHTQMQTSFGMILLAVHHGQPRELGLAEAIKVFIDHRTDVVRRRTQFELRKAREREHVLLGYQIALDNLDAVIQLIRASKNPTEAREGLMTRFALSEIQAKAILDLQLQRLTAMERDKIIEELAEIRKRIAELEEILASEKKLKSIIVQELHEVQKEYGDKRRTEIVEEQAEIKLEDLIAVEDVAVTVSRQGYLKRTPVDTYKHQGRGGKGRIGMRTREEDFVEYLFVASTHSYMLVFTNRGRVYWLKVYEIPDVGTAGRGKNIVNLVNLVEGEAVAAFLTVKDFPEDKYLVMVTRKGVIKKSSLSEFDNPMARGIIAVSLDEGDELIAVRETTGDKFIFLGTHEGKAIRFPERGVRAMGRQARGVRGMDLAKGDYLVGMVAVSEEGWILSVTENGYGKRTKLGEYRVQSRGGKGVINLKTTEGKGKVVSILHVTEQSEVMIITQQGKIIRLESSAIRSAGRSTQGVRLLRMEEGEGDRIAAACLIPETEGNGAEEEKPPLVQ
ncbi:MAG: DNA gyrase subunit A [Acidobacteria bacterium RIFCSPLOWO2_02_FULL_61_28]|nr:MAG: DNA gyrase subunit A [Acidobacteria bacterium RIFCSPLOWO2_02_FULL_61_28]